MKIFIKRTDPGTWRRQGWEVITMITNHIILLCQTLMKSFK